MPLHTLRFDFSKRPSEEKRLALETALENFGSALSSFERGKGWRIELIVEKKPSLTVLNKALSKITDKKPVWIPIKDKDWIKESEKGLPPISIGPFFIHGAHYRKAIPKGKKAFLIDAGMAFGTGRHETTSLCLLALNDLKQQGFSPKKILDLGTGTGILAFAAHYLFPKARIYAVDNDRNSIRIAKENAAINESTKGMQIFLSDGYQSPRLLKAGPFDMIIANILANPLVEMAPDLKKNLAPKAYALLSGLMNDQEKAVLRAHKGLKTIDLYQQKNWSALLLQKK